METYFGLIEVPAFSPSSWEEGFSQMKEISFTLLSPDSRKIVWVRMTGRYQEAASG